jgi:hypothetical protein
MRIPYGLLLLDDVLSAWVLLELDDDVLPAWVELLDDDESDELDDDSDDDDVELLDIVLSELDVLPASVDDELSELVDDELSELLLSELDVFSASVDDDDELELLLDLASMPLRFDHVAADAACAVQTQMLSSSVSTQSAPTRKGRPTPAVSAASFVAPGPPDVA